MRSVGSHRSRFPAWQAGPCDPSRQGSVAKLTSDLFDRIRLDILHGRLALLQQHYLRPVVTLVANWKESSYFTRTTPSI